MTQFIEKVSSLVAGADIASMLESGKGAKDFAGAVQIFQRVMEANPNSAEALAGLVRSLTGMQDHLAARGVDQLSDGA